MKQDNSGLSLVELIVVIAILAVLTTAGIDMMGYMNGKQARECAYKIDSALANTRMETMSKATGKNDVFLTIFKGEKESYYSRLTVKGETKTEQIGSSKVRIRAYAGADREYDVSDGTEVTFYFNRATGALQAENAAAGVIPYDRIEITQGAVVYEVTIVPATGKFSYGRK